MSLSIPKTFDELTPDWLTRALRAHGLDGRYCDHIASRAARDRWSRAPLSSRACPSRVRSGGCRRAGVAHREAAEARAARAGVRQDAPRVGDGIACLRGPPAAARRPHRALLLQRVRRRGERVRARARGPRLARRRRSADGCLADAGAARGPLARRAARRMVGAGGARHERLAAERVGVRRARASDDDGILRHVPRALRRGGAGACARVDRAAAAALHRSGRRSHATDAPPPRHARRQPLLRRRARHGGRRLAARCERARHGGRRVSPRHADADRAAPSDRARAPRGVSRAFARARRRTRARRKTCSRSTDSTFSASRRT